MHTEEVFADFWILEDIGGAPRVDHFATGKDVSAVGPGER